MPASTDHDLAPQSPDSLPAFLEVSDGSFIPLEHFTTAALIKHANKLERQAQDLLGDAASLRRYVAGQA